MADNVNKPSAGALVVREVLDAVAQDKSGQINVNILIQQATEKAHTSSEIITTTEQAIELARKHDEARIESFKARVEAIIDAKTRDPDEIQKRKNNGVRRCLKLMIGGIAIVAISGGITVAAVGGGIVVATLLLLTGVVSVAMMGPLASGESVSASDVVQILQGMGNLVTNNKEDQKKKK